MERTVIGDCPHEERGDGIMTDEQTGQFYGVVILVSHEAHEEVHVYGAVTKATSRDVAREAALAAGAEEALSMGWDNPQRIAIAAQLSGPYQHPNTALKAANAHAEETAQLIISTGNVAQTHTSMLYDSDDDELSFTDEETDGVPDDDTPLSFSN
jgi:hypothetical protein